MDTINRRERKVCLSIPTSCSRADHACTWPIGPARALDWCREEVTSFRVRKSSHLSFTAVYRCITLLGYLL